MHNLHVPDEKGKMRKAHPVLLLDEAHMLNREENYSFIEKRIHDWGNSSLLYTKGALALIHQVSFAVLVLLPRLLSIRPFCQKQGRWKPNM